MSEYKRQLEEGGISSLLKWLHVLEMAQDYEACAEIKRVIDEHNKESLQQYPTRLEKEQIYLLK